MPLVVYSVLRLALLVAALVVLWLVGLGGWLLVVVATIVAWALSYLLLTGHRTAAAQWLAERAEQRAARRAAGADPDAAAEDAEAEAVRAPAEPDPTTRDRAPDLDEHDGR